MHLTQKSPMQKRWSLLPVLALCFALLASAPRVRAQAPKPPANPAPLYVANFIDITPNNISAGVAAVRQYVEETRKDPGIIRCVGLSQSSRPNHLFVIEVWKDQKAFEHHEELQHTREFRAKVAPLLGSPFDQRLHFVIE